MPASDRDTDHTARTGKRQAEGAGATDRRLRTIGALLALPLLAAACEGPQSALSGAGQEGAEVGRLFWWMLGAAAVIWLLVLGGAIWAVMRPLGRFGERGANYLVLLGGVVAPTLLLSVLLFFGLNLLPDGVMPEERLRVEVRGEQWWWRVRYSDPATGELIATANEIRLPVDRPVEFVLDADEVIHSFWIPALGGKLDMFPGRVNRLLLTPRREGSYLGACAEYCGLSHALMKFTVEVEDAAGFDDWLARQAAPATMPAGAAERRGAELFSAVGCAGCHRIRGQSDLGDVGPDLTHVGSRPTIGAGLLPNTPQNLLRWIARPGAVKPGAKMPAYDMLAPADLADLAAYLTALK